MHRCLVLIVLSVFFASATALRYEAAWEAFNLNQNKSAINPTDYWGVWENHTFQPSPSNWRFPFYSFFVDRYVNGDPHNDNANGTAWEHDPTGTQLRHGGDIKGVQDSLDYIHGLGIRGIYLAGSPFMNFPWMADAFSPIDQTLLDQHFGDIQAWRDTINAIHDRGMYVILENTMATMGNLIGFDGYPNVTAPWSFREHNVLWKSDRQYHDYVVNNTWEEVCPYPYPRFWNQSGIRYDNSDTQAMVGCRDSEFDQYGEVTAFGDYPEWRKQLSKFASVQDRLREWNPEVRKKIELYSCMQISMLDIDGFRMDKAMQITVDAQGSFAAAMRECARRHGKNNFFIPGEIVNGNTNAAIYIGRGKEPSMKINDLTQAVTLKNQTFIREEGQQALDAGAFHYSTYRALMRFLGLDGNLIAAADTPVNFFDAWAIMVQTNDFANANTGEFDPRHMHGASNQDVLRWPGLTDGTERQLLGAFVTTLEMPGIPMVNWGEEQAFYVLDNTAANYVFGRQAMSSSQAWQMHGCYKVGTVNLHNAPFNSSLVGCQDDSVSLDHRDPSHPVYNIYKMMFEMRNRYPVLNDGWTLSELSESTFNITLPGSEGMPTEMGLWSGIRSRFEGVQDFTGIGQGNQSVWVVKSNLNTSRTYTFNCSDPNDALIAPFDVGTTVRNLFYPFDEWTLQASPVKRGFEGSDEFNGCLPSMPMTKYGFKAFVPSDMWLAPSPVITKFIPGHDHRILSSVGTSETETVPIELHFSASMSCDSVTNSILVNSTTELGAIAALDVNSIRCSDVGLLDPPRFYGGVPTGWVFLANIVNVANGIHEITVDNATSRSGDTFTNSKARFMFRIGQADNPMVFPGSANYSSTLLFEDQNLTNGATGSSSLYVSHRAAGAELFRYSLTWGSSWSEWMPYTGGNTSLQKQPWSGTKAQEWPGQHVRVQYWSRASGSSDHFQEGEPYGSNVLPRRFPHLFVHGPFNQYGYDAGIANEMKQDRNGSWTYNFMTEWPAQFQVNVWGINPDGQPDITYAMGDVNHDHVLDRIAPDSLEHSLVNITGLGPEAPYLAYQIKLNDADLRYTLVPIGSRWKQLALFILLAVIPALTAIVAVVAYLRIFYKVKINLLGLTEGKGVFIRVKKALRSNEWLPEKFTSRPSSRQSFFQTQNNAGRDSALSQDSSRPPSPLEPITMDMGPANLVQTPARTVLIGTMEYNIEDWNIKIKIGGLGVMAQLMGNIFRYYLAIGIEANTSLASSLPEKNLVWVVPCVGGIDYPEDFRAEPMVVTILGQPYDVNVQYHQVKNITYVLLDAPVFRKQTKAEPYPARMDDLESAIYYSAWNQCLAATIRRFPIDLYHINDYHGTLAPLYLLPDMLPCCLSLHNAEFQGLWPMRTPEERKQICSVFNLAPDIVKRYVQFGEVFNLLHAGASILRIHQDGFGAVGVSKKYGKRSYARYPIFWGLKKIGALPNPDPSDVAEWDKKLAGPNDYVIDEEFEKSRVELKREAQEWAGLEQRADADLFVFVGRWSMQKGIDLIADVFPGILEKYPQSQLICIGPVIDLYGKFAALKLGVMMKKYPGRVYSKPEFTALPPFIFSGAEFALIPSRDEPFGLVAVEFGRKGALGVGSRVGGLGQMPGWWFTIESQTTKHLVNQFKAAIQAALSSGQDIRKVMRARSAKQRFPVAQWKEDLEILQATSIRQFKKQAAKRYVPSRSGTTTPAGGWQSPRQSGSGWASPMMLQSPASSVPPSRSGSVSRYTPRPSADYKRASSEYNLASKLRRSARESPTTGSQGLSAPNSRSTSPVRAMRNSGSFTNLLSLGRRHGPGHFRNSSESEGLDLERGDASTPTLPIQPAIPEDEVAQPSDLNATPTEVTITAEQAAASRKRSHIEFLRAAGLQMHPMVDASSQQQRRITFESPMSSPIGSPIGSPMASPPQSAPSTPPTEMNVEPDVAKLQLSLSRVMEKQEDKKPQDLTPFFTDPTGLYYRMFERMLDSLNGKTSEGRLCIEEYLAKSEKQWFNRYNEVKMGREPKGAKGSRFSVLPTTSSDTVDSANDTRPESVEMSDLSSTNDDGLEQFLLPADYKPPTKLRRVMNTKIGDWPLYAFFLALGQIISANSYQMTLLTGENGQKATKLYVVASIYLAATSVWWFCFRKFQSKWVMSAPWAFYGLAFFLLGMAPYGSTWTSRGWIQNVATGLYAFASASGSLFFAQNFGSTGSAPIKAWAFRACAIAGTQQIYIVALWFWGSRITSETVAGHNVRNSTVYGTQMTAITVPIALLLWGIGVALFYGLPEFYRQAPGAIPSFYASVVRRKIILWFFVAVVIQNFFLSAPTGRNWAYLWSSQHAPAWTIVLLVVLFFIIIWAASLFLFGHLSTTHSWILPIFAIGLGAPRWCQMLWSTSNNGAYLPWAGSPIASALLGRSLWLWLGLLDSLQGIGFGMILLQTLTRFHITFTLMAAQLFGSVATIVARACAPDNTGPGDVFPNFTGGWSEGLKEPWFWITLAFQLLICVGYFAFFRKEQLSKP